jgi:hypothetical protein
VTSGRHDQHRDGVPDRHSPGPSRRVLPPCSPCRGQIGASRATSTTSATSRWTGIADASAPERGRSQACAPRLSAPSAKPARHLSQSKTTRFPGATASASAPSHPGPFSRSAIHWPGGRHACPPPG